MGVRSNSSRPPSARRTAGPKGILSDPGEDDRPTTLPAVSLIWIIIPAADRRSRRDGLSTLTNAPTGSLRSWGSVGSTFIAICSARVRSASSARAHNEFAYNA